MASLDKQKKDAGFENNFRKLEQLAKELGENSVSVDKLVPRMKEAVSAIKACKSVLAETTSQLEEISAEFSSREE